MQHLTLRSWFAAVVALVAAAALWTACDTAPGPVPLDQQPPEVADLVVVPETIRAAALPPEQIDDGEATIDITTTVTARDPDGTVDRVLVVLDPSYGPSAGVVAQLPRIEGDRYGGTGGFPVTVDRANVLMVRAFAVDNDSLTSNEVVGRIYVLPDTTSNTDG